MAGDVDEVYKSCRRRLMPSEGKARGEMLTHRNCGGCTSVEVTDEVEDLDLGMDKKKKKSKKPKEEEESGGGRSGAGDNE
eukprot:753917-Hanusia_phi.AAC.3